MEYQYEIEKERLSKDNLNKLMDWFRKKGYDLVELSDKIIVKGEDFYIFYRLDKVLEAMEAGYNFEDAIRIIEDDWELLSIDMKKASNKNINHYRRIVSRVIGEKGRFIRQMEKVSGAKMLINDKKLYILGNRIDSYSAYEGMKRLIGGTPHTKIEDIITRTKRHIKNKEKEAQYKLNL